MEKIVTVNPLDGDDRSTLNKYFEDGWTTIFHFPIKTDNLLIIYYHLQKAVCEQCGGELDGEEEEEFEHGPDSEDEDDDNWRIH